MTKEETIEEFKIHALEVTWNLTSELSKKGIIPNWQSDNYYFSKFHPIELLEVSICQERERLGFHTFDRPKACVRVEIDHNPYAVKKRTHVYHVDKNGKINYEKIVQKIIKWTEEMKLGIARFRELENKRMEGIKLQEQELGKLPTALYATRLDDGLYSIEIKYKLTTDQVKEIARIVKGESGESTNI